MKKKRAKKKIDKINIFCVYSPVSQSIHYAIRISEVQNCTTTAITRITYVVINSRDWDQLN